MPKHKTGRVFLPPACRTPLTLSLRSRCFTLHQERQARPPETVPQPPRSVAHQ